MPATASPDRRRTKIWAAGVEASPLGRMVAEAAGARLDRASRVHVRPSRSGDHGDDLQVSRDRERYARAHVGRRGLAALTRRPPGAVHLVALTGFKNRIAVLFTWTIAFVGRGRPQRAITTQQVFARQVGEAQAAAVNRGAAAFRPSSRG